MECESSLNLGVPPDIVSQQTIPFGEVRDRWSWAEPSIWTERMLTALERGVKHGIWYSMMDKVCRLSTLRIAFEKVKSRKGSAGIDHQTITLYERHLESNLQRLLRRLTDGSYRPKAVKRVWIDKPGKREQRPLGIPTVEDRIVQTALLIVIEPIFEREFSDVSFGFRPGRGCKDALRQVQRYLDEGYTWVLDADLKGYFDSIDHEILLSEVRKKLIDGKMLRLIELFLDQSVVDVMASWTPESGTPQGAVISPLLANIFLNPLDYVLASLDFKIVRYADDFVVLCKSESEARRALSIVQDWVDSVQLTLHPEKTVIVEAVEDGFDFLGYHFQNGTRYPSEKSLRRLKDKIRAETKRTNGYSLEAIVLRLNRILRGWFEYFKHSRWRIFKILDGWIRMRLRSILRKRNNGRGRGGGLDHFKWPNSYFSELGLFSLLSARRTVCQSVVR